MPWIIDRLATAEVALVLADLDAVLPDHDTIGISVDLGRTTDSRRQHRVFVVVETNEAGFADRDLGGVEAVEPSRISDKLRPFLLEHLPDRALVNGGVKTGHGAEQKSATVAPA